MVSLCEPFFRCEREKKMKVKQTELMSRTRKSKSKSRTRNVHRYPRHHHHQHPSPLPRLPPPCSDRYSHRRPSANAQASQDLEPQRQTTWRHLVPDDPNRRPLDGSTVFALQPQHCHKGHRICIPIGICESHARVLVSNQFDGFDSYETNCQFDWMSQQVRRRRY